MTEKLQSRMSSPNSIWLRSIRYLTHEGKTLPHLTSILVKSTTELVLPFGVMTQTENNRLIFWPVLPKHLPQVSEHGRLIDHITLELSNGKSHSTAFDADGVRHHRSNGWKLHEILGSGLKMWFSMLVRWDVIQDQDLRVEVDMATPVRDGERRVQEFRKHASNLNAQFILLPHGERAGNYVYCVFYLQATDTFDVSPAFQSFLGDNVDDRIDSMPDGTTFPIQPAQLQVGKTKLLVLTATPIGSATNELIFGFPYCRGG
jgi:hypothetical protein